MATRKAPAPAGLRKVTTAVKAAIATTSNPHAVAKAMVPVLRDHAAKLKSAAPGKAVHGQAKPTNAPYSSR